MENEQTQKDVNREEMYRLKNSQKPIREGITRSNHIFLRFNQENPDSATFGAYQMSQISVMDVRIRSLMAQAIRFNFTIEQLMESDTSTFSESDIQDEKEQALQYSEMGDTMIYMFEIVYKEKHEKAQLELNQSLHTPPNPVTPLVSDSFLASTPFLPRTRFTGVKTPVIELPQFNGDYLLWPSFIDRFVGMIDKNDTFSPVHKLDYLKSCLKGEPARMIQNLTSIDDNYEIAMGMLRSRYLDEWPMIAKYLEIMLNFKQLTSKSSKELRRLHETFQLNTQGLRNLGFPFENFVMVFLMATKLDSETRELWEQRVVELPRTAGRQAIPDAELIFNFIDQRARTLEHSQQFKLGITPTSSKKVTGAAVTEVPRPVADSFYGNTSKPFVKNPDKKWTKTRQDLKPVPIPARDESKCSHCNGDHKIWNCDAFKTASMEDKKSSVSKAKLCLNCLSPGHQTKACSSKFSCKFCKSRHHSLIHSPVSQSGGSSS